MYSERQAFVTQTVKLKCETLFKETFVRKQHLRLRLSSSVRALGSQAW